MNTGNPTVLSRLLCLGLLALTPAMSRTARAEPPAATQPADAALAAVHQYCNMLKSGDGVRAAEHYWDFDQLFDGIFGDDMKKQSPAEREQMRKLMLAFISEAYTKPNVLKIMKASAFDGFTSKELPDHRVQVDFNLRFPAGQVLPNTLYMRADSSGWRIVDAAVNGNGTSEQLRSSYLKSRETVTPLQYVQAIGRLAKSEAATKP